jgi:hypothetical protein
MRQAKIQSAAAKNFLVDKFEEYQDRYDNTRQIRLECAELVVNLRSPKRRSSSNYPHRNMISKIEDWDDGFDILEVQAVMMEEWQGKFHGGDSSSTLNKLPTIPAFKASIDIQISRRPIVVKKKRYAILHKLE